MKIIFMLLTDPNLVNAPMRTIADKLPEGLTELYQVINKHATALGITYLVVGATARDIVLVHGYGANVERGTRDIDLGPI